MFLEQLAKWPALTPASLLATFEDAYKSEWWILCFSASEKEDLFNEFIEEWEPTYWEEYRATRKKRRLAVCCGLCNYLLLKDYLLQILDFLRSSPKISIDLT